MSINTCTSPSRPLVAPDINGDADSGDKTDEDIIKTNLAANAGTNQIKDTDHLLQEMDINRLRAVVYR